MGTNYYYQIGIGTKCPTCGHEPEGERLHIGKASAGWVFSLRIHPDLGIATLNDWMHYWLTHPGQIWDESGEFVSFKDMLETITQRSHPTGLRTYDRNTGITSLIREGDPTYHVCDYEFS